MNLEINKPIDVVGIGRIANQTFHDIEAMIEEVD